MRRFALIGSLLVAALCGAEEFPRPSERLRALPGDDWLPRRVRLRFQAAWERPLPEIPLWLSELAFQRPFHSRLGAEIWFWSLDSEWIDRRAIGLGLSMSLPGLVLGIRSRAQWVQLDGAPEAARRQHDLALAFGEELWSLGVRGRLRSQELWLDWVAQWRGENLALALEREASPFGAEDLWIFGCATALSPQFQLGAQWRALGTDLLLSLRRQRLRVSLALSATGPDPGSIAIGTEWQP